MKNIIQYTLVLILFLSVTAFKIYGQYPQSNRMFFQNKFGITKIVSNFMLIKLVILF